MSHEAIYYYMLLLLWLLASSRDMAPKKKLFDKSTGTIYDVQYTLYENGMLVVGTDIASCDKLLLRAYNIP